VSRLLRAVGVLAIPAVSLPLGMSAAEAVTVPKPPSKSLPSALDVASPYQAQTTCDPAAKPGAVAFAELMKTYYAKTSRTTYGISRNCNSGVTEHSEGRAVDWMLSAYNPTQKAIADSVTQWLSAPDAQGRPGAMARRFGIMYIIWNRKMWRAYDPGRGWAPYTGSVPHTDHIHVSFSWDGAMKRTSWWTGRALTTVGGRGAATSVPTAPSATYSILVQGASGPDVVLAQRALGVPADGVFGPKTYAALVAWQRAQKLPVTGKLDAATWNRMQQLRLVPTRSGSGGSTAAGSVSKPATPKPPTTSTPPTSASVLAPYAKTTLRRGSTGAAVIALQKALGITADGAFGPKTEAAVKAFQTRKHLPANGIVSAATWQALMGKTTTPPKTAPKPATTKPKPATTTPAASTTTPYTAYLRTTLRTGSRGEAVKVLQRALGGVAVDGAYGARTAAAVSAFQKASKLGATGVADPAVWRALENRDYPLRAYYGTVLRSGSKGAAVVALQKALRITADGAFGPKTQTAVKALQKRAKIAQTGTVAAVTWKAVEAELRRR
jgi:peptidoglycan hydrolase-like protein with peptidoglycan-binding domain